MKTKMKKRTLHRCSALTALALVMSLMFSMSPLAMAANLNSVHDILFDWEYYADNNPDVVQALGRTESAMRWHYETYGKGEGMHAGSVRTGGRTGKGTGADPCGGKDGGYPQCDGSAGERLRRDLCHKRQEHLFLQADADLLY